MNRYRFSKKAKSDLRSIWSYIAVDNIEVADRVEEAIYEACALLAKAPLTGHTREDLTELPLRFWVTVQWGYRCSSEAVGRRPRWQAMAADR
jgi:plasmid stabilization system protein ParE